MRQVTLLTQCLPYTLTLNPQTATVPRTLDQTLAVTGSVLVTNVRNAYTGDHSDTVVLTITP